MFSISWWMHHLKFGFELLDLWKKVRAFKKEVCSEARKFPVNEKYLLTHQVIRSCRSINSQIAEGHGRFTYPDRIHFCIESRGSLSETINHLIDAFDEGYITEEKLNYYRSNAKEIEKIMNGYINYLRRQKDINK